MGRYQRNGTCIDPAETLALHEKRVCLVGLGGLGGYLLEMLGRAGVGHFTAIDSDVFDETNLNRQLLSSVDNLGQPKAAEAKARMQKVNPEVAVAAIRCRVEAGNVRELLSGHDLVMDAVDDIPTRLLMEEACEALGLPLVHGAIGGWYGQVSVIYPGDRTLHRLYDGVETRGEEAVLGTPSFTPALVASLQTAEAVKLLLGKGTLLRRRLLTVDLLQNSYESFPI